MKYLLLRPSTWTLALATAAIAIGCASGEEDSAGVGPRPDGGVDAAGGAAGTAGSGNAGGTGGGTGGSAGAAGSAGATGGAGGSAGTGGSAGSAGAGGIAGSAGASGAGGVAGSAGAAGASGAGGTAGVAGAAGAAGAAGTAGACGTDEVCNGLDDNCNGVLDENDPGGGVDCTVSSATGLCAVGRTSCLMGTIVCVPQYTPSSEICNGADDNCNGSTDEGNPGGNQPCNTGEQGVCAIGTSRCDATLGAITCDRNIQPSAEVCNGVDDDCDGTPDQGFPGAGQPCAVQGVIAGTPCASGLSTCQGQTGCAQTYFPSTDICDGIDNDCNGTVDDGVGLTGTNCDTGDLGICAPGRTNCVAGTPVCEPIDTPTTETCNARDDDCDGTVDNIANLDGECSARNPAAGSVAGWECIGGFCTVNGCLTGFANCNNASGDGCEVDLSSSVPHCGACGSPCNATNGTPSCVSGSCVIACNAPYGNCDGDAQNGCEANVNTSTGNCGACGQACTNANGGTTCVSGTCVPTCSTGYGNCDGDVRNGCETSTNFTTEHCGGCNLPCVNPNGSTSCDAGACVPVCTGGGANCDGNARNGCEVDLDASTSNCGSCGTRCTNNQGTTQCVSGLCEPNCNVGFADCDGNPNNGCETNVYSSALNCGACGIQCLNANGTTSCIAGQCVPVCAGSYQNCDGVQTNGCESNRSTDSDNCGGCNLTCTNDHGSTGCSSGLCQPVCDPGWANCDGTSASARMNGCEQSTTDDPNNCGGCGIVCSNDHGTTACVNSVCVPSCAPGWSDCSNPRNGCETNTGADVSNCGSCGNVCTNPQGSVSCAGGICQVGCNAPYANCDGSSGNGCEVNTGTDINNCGGCGTRCVNANGTSTCVSSNCVVLTCTAPYANCDNNGINGCETDTSSTVTSCGACNQGCSNDHGTTSCVNSVCVPACTGSWADCDGNPRNGCETDTSVTTAHCGGCNMACLATGGTTQCTNSTCQPSCSAGNANCDNNPRNGCETNTLSSLAHCSACNTLCDNPHGGEACNAGVCSVISCDVGWQNCDGIGDNGCERSVSDDVNNCGGCGTTCPTPPNTAGAACTGTTCGYTACNSGWHDASAGVAGCECRLDSESNTCGSARQITVAVDASGNTNTLVAPGATLVAPGDVDWYQITFASANACTFGPRIDLQGSADVKMQVFTSCGTGAGAGSQACEGAGEPAGSSAATGITQLTFNIASCGALMQADPADPPFNNGDFALVYYVRVFWAGAAGDTSCRSYNLTWSN